MLPNSLCSGPSARPILVLKFGSSVLACREDLPKAVHEIYRGLRSGYRVVVVVSAMGRTTDRLLGEAQEMSVEPNPGALAALLRLGEAETVARLLLALDQAGIPASALTPESVGLQAEGPKLDARPVDLDVGAVCAALDRRPVAVIPGFVGCAYDGGTALFGRGGSDLTALFLADRLEADRCVLVKDVDGVYDRDPSGSAPCRRYARLSWDDAIALDGGVVQEKALRFARERELEFEVAALGRRGGTLIGQESVPAPEAEPVRPLRVGLLGLGTVGYGVYRRLLDHPEEFEVVAACVRDVQKHVLAGVPAAVLTTDPQRVLDAGCDVIVELVGGLGPAGDWIAAALSRGIDVVTANKALVAERGLDLLRRAALRRSRLLFSASVGGGLPLVENVEDAALQGGVEGFEGVLNGTTNFVLDRVADGVDFTEAVREAQERGFAEADPTADLDGSDAAANVVILARAAFGARVSITWRERGGIEGLDSAEMMQAREQGRVLRLVAACIRTEAGCDARIALRALPPEHPLARIRGEENRLVIRTAAGEELVVSGKGAGRWPTAESVIGDLFAVHRMRGQRGFVRIASAG